LIRHWLQQLSLFQMEDRCLLIPTCMPII